MPAAEKSPSPAAVAPAPGEGWVRWFEPASVAGLFGYLLASTWMKWPDAMIDFARNLYIPWRMSQGALLYDQVRDWYGPLPSLVVAGAFRLFGPSLHLLVWMNVVVAILSLVLLRAIFRILGDRLMVWLASVVFLVGFCFAQYVGLGNYNFMTPYATQATYGFMGLLLAIWALLRHNHGGKGWWLFLAGFGVAFGYLNKPEPLLASTGAVGVYWLVATIRGWRSRPPVAGWWQTSLVMIGWLAAGFLALWGATFLLMAKLGGSDYAWRAVNRVVMIVMAPDVRQTLREFKIFNWNIGLDHPWENFATRVGQGLLLVGFFFGIGLAGMAWARARVEKRASEGQLLVVLGLAGVACLITTWLEIGRALLFPGLAVMLGAIGWSLRKAWRREGDGRHALDVAVYATAGMLMLLRIFLNSRIAHYGFYMAPLALLLIVYLMVYEAPRWWPRDGRPNELLQLVFTLLVLAGVGSVGQISAGVFAQKTYPVSAGGDRFYTFSPERGSPYGFMVNGMMAAVKQLAPQAKTLVAFPEGESLNYYLRLPSSIPEMEFNPVSLSFAGGPDAVLEHLKASPPDVVMLYNHDLREHDELAPFFGATDKSGKKILEWVAANYVVITLPREILPPTQKMENSATGHLFDLLVRKDLANAK